MDDARTRDTGPVALAAGLVVVGSAACIATYFAVGGPFGTMNDVGNAAAGVLGGLLAWRLHRHVASRASAPAAGLAVIGAAVSVVGSALVVSGTTGWLLASLVSSVGFAAIGTSLVVANRSAVATAWPRGLRRLGIAAGALMAVGVILAPGIALGLDDAATAPGWVWLGFTGWLGTYVVFPIWAIRVWMVEARRSGRARLAPAGSAATD